MRHGGAQLLNGKYMAKSKGLGDTIEKLTKFSGIKPLVKKMNGGKDCGTCEKNRKSLNKKFPYKK